jgi:hypothetical protein
VIIDGKPKSLQNRKFCLTCSPYGKHNTKKDPSAPTKERHRLPYGKWNEKDKENARKNLKERGWKRKQKLIDLKGGKCQMCGYYKCPRSLSFHHRNPKEKQYNLDVRVIRGIKWSTILEEVEKCDLLCLNCHNEVEFEIDRQKEVIRGIGYDPIVGRL